ncbi:haloacid dehalogenase [Dacryopinax primogenitus]|uniref:Haloacid dehalogenase n=1 Tax=Dacryopinax primogenitus (strain DJM 731) TaxID=1858805 RepID=M5FV74_DACPD|nr:haloacid dehalogenase [Dacryopinax primogenitus]EJU00169.1 haloacid dehalogenase [Dacryopinax primogenitus]
MSSQPRPLPQALIFDLVGTCTDWHTPILDLLRSQPLPTPLQSADLPQLAADWRAGFFREILASFEGGEQAEGVDIVHRRVLDRLLQEQGVGSGDDGMGWGEDVRQKLVIGWHEQAPWPDSIEGLQKLKKKFMVVVLANGTTRLQLDVVRSSGLAFHALFSSQLLGYIKPSPDIYLKALDLLAIAPEQALMVAAHAYDLRAAARVGIRTAYIQRATEDPQEDMDKVRGEVDLFFDGIAQGQGLLALAQYLRA